MHRWVSAMRSKSSDVHDDDAYGQLVDKVATNRVFEFG
jgi:hypothetical protein